MSDSRKLQSNQPLIDRPSNETKYLCRRLDSSVTTTMIVERELMPSLGEAKGTLKALLRKRVEVIFWREELTNFDRGNQEAKTLIGFTTVNKEPTTENFMITEEKCY